MYFQAAYDPFHTSSHLFFHRESLECTCTSRSSFSIHSIVVIIIRLLTFDTALPLDTASIQEAQADIHFHIFQTRIDGKDLSKEDCTCMPIPTYATPSPSSIAVDILSTPAPMLLQH